MINDHNISFTETRLTNFTDNDKLEELAKEWHNARTTPPTMFTLDDYLKKKSPGLIGAGRSVRANMLTDFPPLSPECPTEDTPSVLRLLMRGPGLFVDEIGLLRRLHDANLSSTQSLLKMNLLAIEGQYLQDIEAARKKGWISEMKSNSLKNWAKATIGQRAIYIQLKAGVRPSIKKLIAILFSSNFSLKAKIYISIMSLKNHKP
jgi:hypothetical protein